MVNEQPTNTSAKIIDCEPVEWASLNGGKKQQQLRIHRDEIVDFFNTHGPAATLVRYGLMADTLGRLLARSDNRPARRYLFDLENVSLKADMALESSRSTRLQMEALDRKIDEFTLTVSRQVGVAIMEPLRQSLNKALGAGDGDK